MGRQIALVASPQDEQSLLAFLRESGPIQLCVRAAPRHVDLWLDDFPPLDPAQPRYQYFIWNKEFDWFPAVVQRTAEGGGLIADIWAGPVIEFMRTVSMNQFTVDRGACLGRGRIYWAGENPHEGFARWYDRIAAWVRRNGENLSTRGPGCYCLPDALRIWRTSTRPVTKKTAARQR